MYKEVGNNLTERKLRFRKIVNDIWIVCLLFLVAVAVAAWISSSYACTQLKKEVPNVFDYVIFCLECLACDR